MITLRGRELVIPVSERQIGTNYDNNSEVRQFRLPRVNPGGIDISHLDFALSLEYASEARDECMLEKEIRDDAIILTWTIPDSCVRSVGTVWCWIRGHDANGSIKWASNKGAFYVYGKLGDTSEFNGLTALEQMETLLNQVLDSFQETINKAESCIGTTEEAEAWAHGHVDYPEKEEDNSKYYANVSKTYSESAGASEKATTESEASAKEAAERAEASAQQAEAIVGFDGTAGTVRAVDTQGMVSDAGTQVLLQNLIDAVTDHVVNKLLTKSGLVNNALATEAGVAALDAVMGKTLQDQITQQNSNFADATKVETHIAEGLNVYKYGRIVSFVIVNATTNSNGVLDKVIPSRFSKTGWQIPCLYYLDGQKLSGKLVPDTSGNLTLYDASITKVPLATLVTASSTWII